MGLGRFRIEKDKFKNDYVNIDVVCSNIRTSSLRGLTASVCIIDDLSFLDQTTEKIITLDPKK